MPRFGNLNPLASLSALQASVLREVFDARLSRVDATHIGLFPYKGRSIGIKAELVQIPDAGFTLIQSANRIDAAGADAGAALAINTLYYVYVSNSSATFSPLGIRCSTVAPTAVNGVKYLGDAGNALNWRFVGWVRTISNAGTPNFVDTAGGGATAGQRLVVNYYNRQKKDIGFICPGYVDNNVGTQYSLVAGAPTNYAAVTGNVQSSFIANGEDEIQIDAIALFRTSVVDNAFMGVGLDSQTDPVVAMNDAGGYGTKAMSRKVAPAEGYHTLDFLWATGAALTLTVIADWARLGTAADTMMSGYSASIMA